MRVSLLILFIAIATVTAESDESWTWNDDKQKTSRNVNVRYQVHEPSEHLDSFDNGIQLGFRPQNPGPYGPNGRPLVPAYQGNNGVLVGPGGPTGIIGRPPRFGLNEHNGLDSVPPWIRDDPRYREFDTCKCRYSFNCPSPGLKFGHCAREKKYCCFNSKRFPGLSEEHHYPYYPGAPHKYRPNGFAPTSIYYGNRRPYNGGYQHPSFGSDYYSGTYSGSYGDRNEFESLRPHDYDPEFDDYVIYGRSLGKNQTQPNEEPKTHENTRK